MQPPTMDVWKSLLTAYQDMRQPDHKAAAAIAGVSVLLAKHAYSKGWPAKGMMPILDTIESERLRARARRHHLEDKMRAQRAAEVEAAIDDEAASRAIEGVMAREAQLIANDLLLKCRDMARAAAPLADSVISGMAALAADTTGTKDNEKLGKLRMVMDFTEQAMRLAKQAMDLETVHMGRTVDERRGGAEDVGSLATALIHKLGAAYGLKPSPALPAPPKVIEVVASAEVVEVEVEPDDKGD